VKCTQYGICSQAAFKNARAFFVYCFRAGRASVFGRGQKFRGEGCPPPGSDTLIFRRGYFNIPWVRTGNYDSFNLGKGLLQRIPKKYGKMCKIWHLLTDNDKVFNHGQWHESKVKQRIWDKFIIFAKVTWNQVIEQIKISSFSAAAMLQGFDKLGVLGTTFVEGIICISSGIRKGNIDRRPWQALFRGGSWWLRGCPWLSGYGELSVVVVWCCYILRGNISRSRAPSPLSVGISWF
jgi:hypothetical protein